MKTFKRITAAAISLLLCVGIIHPMTAGASTAPSTQNWETTMAKGSTAAFTVENAQNYSISWYSSNKSIAAVDKKTGMVKALKLGSTKIKAKLIKGKKVITLSGKLKVVKAQSTIISTKYGKVKGQINGRSTVWYGIPYAANPIGELRWSEPKSPKKWTKTLDCTEEAPIALQTKNSKVVGTTDCLNLDIYTPSIKKSNLPVLVFLHGGNNQTGSSGDFIGTDISADLNCIVVSINYRLGLLGFNCLPALTNDSETSGNFTLYDIQKSLQWIQDNIKKFGGNPNNVTVSGSSAGGRDVMAMLISPLYTGLFHKALVNSGGMTTSDVDQSASQIATFLAPLAVKYKKSKTETDAKEWLLTNDKKVSKFLYSLSSEEIISAVGDAKIRMSAFPHLYTDGITLPKEGFHTNACNDVPVIMMTGADEFSTFNFSNSAYVDGSIDKSEVEQAKAFANKYGSLMYGYFNTTASAQTLTENNYESPIYLMNCNFGHDSNVWPMMAIGSFHCIPLSLIDKHTTLRKMFSSAYETAGGKQLTKMAEGYVKDFLWSSEGNPNADTRQQWTAYTSDYEKWLELDATPEKAFADIKDIEITSYQPVLEAMDADTTISSSAKSAVIKTVLNGRWFSSELDLYYKNENLWK